MVQKICTLFFVGCIFQQIFHQKNLIAGRGNLCHKNFISGINIRLRLVGIVRMHCMSHLMCQRKHIIQCTVVIQQYIRMTAICSGRICTASLSLILIDIDPAVFKTFFYFIDIVLAQRCKCL